MHSSKTTTLFSSADKALFSTTQTRFLVLGHPKGRTSDLSLDVAVCPSYIYPTMFTPSLVRFFLHQLTKMCILATNTYTHCRHNLFNVTGSFRCDIWLNGSPCFQILQNHHIGALCRCCRSGNRPYYQTPSPEPAPRGRDATEFGTRPALEVDWDQDEIRINEGGRG